MKRRLRYIFVALILVLLSAGALLYVLRSNEKVQIGQCVSVGRSARIRPDYCGTTIPPNIAPLNFLVQEAGSYCYVKIYSKQGRPIEVFSKTPKISIPEKPWHELLDANRGQELYFDIFVKTQNNQWSKFDTITNTIANEEIDPFLVYRRMHPTYTQRRGKISI